MTPEFSRPLPVDRIGGGKKSFAVTAEPAECRALAERFGLLAIDALSAQLTAQAIGPLIHLAGRLSARVLQACVITLEPVAAAIDEPFHITFGPEIPEEGDEIVIDLEAEDPPEPITDGRIDLGEVVAEHLALALDPFPRAPGARFEAPGDEQTSNPFGLLAAFRKESPE